MAFIGENLPEGVKGTIIIYMKTEDTKNEIRYIMSI